MVDHERAARRRVKLRDIMHPSVSVTPDVSARETLRVMLENNVPAVPVVEEDERLIGFISDGQLLSSALPRYITMMDNLSFISENSEEAVHYLTAAADRPVSEVMSKDVARIELGKSALEAARQMVVEGVSSVVVTEKGKMVGIVTRLDLYAAIIGLNE